MCHDATFNYFAGPGGGGEGGLLFLTIIIRCKWKVELNRRKLKPVAPAEKLYHTYSESDFAHASTFLIQLET